LLYNTFEWCAPGVESEMELLQDIEMEVVADWNRRFAEDGEICISSVDRELNPSDEDYRLLQLQGVESLMAAPLKINDEIVGFVGVDNPRLKAGSMDLLHATSDFVVAELEKRRMSEKLKKLSFTDLLTGVYNRNSYIRDLDLLHQNVPERMGMIVVDVNGLKATNDRYGHRYGDNLIKATASILSAHLDMPVYRVGGDEFSIPCPGMEEKQFDRMVRDLRAAFDATEHCSVAIGATYQAGEVDIDQLTMRADEMMYAEKESYYQAAFYSGEKVDSANVTAELLKDMEEGRFIVHYQPQVDMDCGAILGTEAVVRKLDDEGRLILPGRFVPLYEAQGIQMHLDMHVLDTVLKLYSTLPEAVRPPRMSVNFSRTTLLMSGFTAEIQKKIDKYGVDPKCITLEITESVSKLGPALLKKLIESIHQLGLRVALDDFGTQYSNLSILTDIGFDVVKLDKSLVDDVCTNSRSQIILRNVIRMCRELGSMDIVVEGIENESQSQVLKGYLCHCGQGNLFYRPMPEEDFVKLLYEKRR